MNIFEINTNVFKISKIWCLYLHTAHVYISFLAWVVCFGVKQSCRIMLSIHWFPVRHMKTRYFMREHTTVFYISDYFTESWHGIALFLIPAEWHFHMNRSIKTMCHCIAKCILIYHSLYLIDKIWPEAVFLSSPDPDCSCCWNIWDTFATLHSNNFNFVFRYFLCSCLFMLEPEYFSKVNSHRRINQLFSYDWWLISKNTHFVELICLFF